MHDGGFSALEEIERQMTLEVNERTNHVRGPGEKFGWQVSPNIARASPSRQSKPPAAIAAIRHHEPAEVAVIDHAAIARARWSGVPLRSR